MSLAADPVKERSQALLKPHEGDRSPAVAGCCRSCSR